MKIFLLFLSLLIIRFYFSFIGYVNFKSKPILSVEARVVNQYRKKNYFVLKLKNSFLEFYTTSRDDLKYLLNRKVNIKIVTKKVSLWGYLTKFYAPSFDLKLLPESKPEIFIQKQHKDEKFSNLFKALFFGESIDYEIRKKLSALGISHLFALSGLHLGFISFVLYWVFYPFYNIFHKRRPYRNRYIDLGVIVLGFEFLYLFFSGFAPSLIRAFVMESVGFVSLLYLNRLVELKVLFYTLLISFLVFFTKILSIGFLLSFLGVYYIFVFFRHVRVGLLSSFFLSFYMFFVMFVISHYFFPQMNVYQLLSPLANILFGIFYPLEFLAHLFNYGGVFDNVLREYLNLGNGWYEFKTPLWFMVMFLGVSVFAFFNKKAFYGINLLGIGLIIYAL